MSDPFDTKPKHVWIPDAAAHIAELYRKIEKREARIRELEGAIREIHENRWSGETGTVERGDEIVVEIYGSTPVLVPLTTPQAP